MSQGPAGFGLIRWYADLRASMDNRVPELCEVLSDCASEQYLALARAWRGQHEAVPEGTRLSFCPADFEDIVDCNVQVLLQLYVQLDGAAHSLAALAANTISAPPDVPMEVFFGDQHARFTKLLEREEQQEAKVPPSCSSS